MIAARLAVETGMNVGSWLEPRRPPRAVLADGLDGAAPAAPAARVAARAAATVLPDQAIRPGADAGPVVFGPGGSAETGSARGPDGQPTAGGFSDLQSRTDSNRAGLVRDCAEAH